jgi:hypothetical protein
MSSHKTYTINSVNDFLSIPPNRLKACLREFRTSLELAHGLSGMAGIDGDKVKVDVSMPSWIWIDDRKRNQDVQFCDVTVKVASDEASETRRAE